MINNVYKKTVGWNTQIDLCLIFCFACIKLVCKYILHCIILLANMVSECMQSLISHVFFILLFKDQFCFSYISFL